VIGLLCRGKVSLMALSLIEPHLTKENGKKLIGEVMGKSKREIEVLLSELSFKKVNYKDVIRRLPEIRIKKEEGAQQQEDDKKKVVAPAGLEGAGGGKAPGAFGGASAFPPPPSQPKTAQNFSFTSESSGAFTPEIPNACVPEPIPVSKPEIRRIKVEFVAEEGLAKKIERAKEILRSKFPQGRFEDIFNQALEDLLEKRDPMRKVERSERRKANEEKSIQEGSQRNEMESMKQTKSNEKGKAMKTEEGENTTSEPQENQKILEKEFQKPKPVSRYIPEKLRLEIWKRDRGECAYMSVDGKKCGSRSTLHVDHVEPFALGGQSIEKNLRLLCARHNRWRAEKTFGRFISKS